jgi:hypothetical protein
VAEPLTVVIPLYNGAEHIGQTLDSLSMQTHALAEVIVVDDGSTDDGAELVAAHPIGATLIRQRNGGVAVARNRGSLEAGTTHITFLDQDDLWLPRRHERLLRFRDAHADLPVFVTGVQIFHRAADRDSLERLGEGFHKRSVFADVTGDHPDLEQAQRTFDRDCPEIPTIERRLSTRDLLAGPFTITSTFIVDRTLFLSVGGAVASARSSDLYLSSLNLSRFSDIVYIDERSVLYRVHPASTTQSTRYPLPVLTGVAAARFGANVVPEGHARDPAFVPPMSPLLRSWLVALAGSGRRESTDALALARLMAVHGGEFKSLLTPLVKQWFWHRVPDRLHRAITHIRDLR